MDDLAVDFSERLEQEKLAALYQFAYGLSHEINNPLTNISARAQALLSSEKDPNRRRTLATIHLQALRAYEMIADLMLFARPPTPRLEPVDLGDLIDSLIAEWQSEAEAQNTEFVWEPPANPICLHADPTQLAVAIGAIIRNGLEALANGGQVTIALSAGPEAEAVISIGDNGPGITPDVRRHLFDPYFSGREAGRGLGLGLSKCWRIIEQHHGKITVESPAEGGALFQIALPTNAP